MLDDKEKQALLEQFRELLDDPDLNIEPNLRNSETNGGIDLFNLFSELVVIKNEVRLQGRQFKSALSLLVDDQTVLQNQLKQSRKQANNQAIRLQTDFLQQLLLLRDRIDAGIEVSSQYRRKRFSLISRSRERRVIQALFDGQQLTLNRLDQILNEMQIKPIKTLGRKFDSRTMNAIAISHDEDYDDGVVSRQIRQGYCWNNQVVRLAEVTVNRIESHVRTDHRN
jgi:molecular chaperone GrpE